MSVALAAILILVFVFFFYGMVFFTRKFPHLTPGLESLRKLLESLAVLLASIGAKKTYADINEVVYRSILLAEAMAVDQGDPREARKQIRQLVNDLHTLLHPAHAPDQLDVDLAVSAYMLLASHAEINETVTALTRSPGSLDVKKATYLAIDVAGEIVSRQDKLGQEYFEALVYGINRALLLIRNNGTNEKNLKKVIALLYRVYKLTKIYRQQKGLKNLTEVEFYEKAVRIFITMRDVFGDDLDGSGVGGRNEV